MDSDAKLVAEEHKLHSALVILLKNVTTEELVIKYTGVLQHLEFLAPWTTFEPSDSEDEGSDPDNPVYSTSYSVQKRMIWENRDRDSQDRRSFIEENRYITANVHRISSSNDDAENATDTN